MVGHLNDCAFSVGPSSYVHAVTAVLERVADEIDDPLEAARVGDDHDLFGFEAHKAVPAARPQDPGDHRSEVDGLVVHALGAGV